MKGKLTTIIAGTILAVTGAALPASAINARQHTFDLPGTTPNTIGQQQVEVSFPREQNILLAANNTNKKGAEQTIIIIKKDGTHTAPPMAQAQAEKYLGNLINKDRLSNLKQALNDVTTPGRGKSTGSYTFNNHSVLHASSGNGEKSVSLFYYDDGGKHYIIAMGEHVDSTSYTFSDYGQPDGDFKKGKTIRL